MVAKHHRAFSTAPGIVAAGAVFARAEGRSVGLRAGQHIVLIGRIAAAVDGFAFLVECGLLGKAGRGAMQQLLAADGLPEEARTRVRANAGFYGL